MALVEITPTSTIKIDLAYATPNNFAGKVIYKRPLCYLHQEAATRLYTAAELAQGL